MSDSARSHLIGWLRRHLPLALFVVMPVAVAALYFGLIAADIYVSTSEFVVRTHTPSVQPDGFVGNLLRGAGIGHQQDNTSVVHDYVMSRDALRQLDSAVGIRAMYSRSDVSRADSFPGFRLNDSFENFFVYYAKHVSVEEDTTSSVITLEVRAFRAADAQLINATLINLAERMVNRLNLQSREDLLKYAERDVAAASERAKAATVALSEYRAEHVVFEANKQAELQLTGIERMQQELISAQSQLVALAKIAPKNPQLPALRDRVANLQQAISVEAKKVTGAADAGSLNAHAAALDRLVVDLDVADKLLGAAIGSLESARSQASNKEVYIERVVEPNMPDYAMEPRRLRSIFTVLLASLLAWGVASLVLASIREHAE